MGGAGLDVSSPLYFESGSSELQAALGPAASQGWDPRVPRLSWVPGPWKLRWSTCPWAAERGGWLEAHGLERSVLCHPSAWDMLAAAQHLLPAPQSNLGTVRTRG